MDSEFSLLAFTGVGSCVPEKIKIGSISFSPPVLTKGKNGRTFASYRKLEKVVFSSIYHSLYSQIDWLSLSNWIGGRRGFSRYSFFKLS